LGKRKYLNRGRENGRNDHEKKEETGKIEGKLKIKYVKYM
jgi:hypothetical protein